MKRRCYYKNGRAYRWYGAKGIKVCKAWLKSFEKFACDVGEPPSSKHTLDRIDGRKNYCKSNCRWVTQKEQMRNTCANIWVEYNGERKVVADWAIALNMTWTAFKQRLDSGWPIEKILTWSKKPRLLSYNGQTLTVPQWAKKLGINKGTLHKRIKDGLSIEECLNPESRLASVLTYKGKTFRISVWSKKLKIPRYTIHNRLRLGWSVEKTLSTPVRERV